MEEIAEMKLTYQAKHDIPLPGKFGAYLGRGDGVVHGEMITGAVVWDLYENQRTTTCDANLVGTIHTQNGAEISFDMLGYFKRRPDTPFWDLFSAIRFKTTDPRYECFNECVGQVAGYFDMNRHIHEYRIAAPRCVG